MAIFVRNMIFSQTVCFIVYMAICVNSVLLALSKSCSGQTSSVKIRILESFIVLNLAFRCKKPCYLASKPPESCLSAFGESNSCSNLRTLSVNSFLGLSDPLSVTGRSCGWGGSYATGQNSSFRVNQHISASSSISDRKTLRIQIS